MPLYNPLPTPFMIGAKPMTGTFDRTTSTMSFNAGTRTFTIAPTGTTFAIYLAGQRYDKASTSVVIPNTVAQHFIYFDSTGTLVSSTTPWDLTSTFVPIATVYWTGTLGTITEERHSAYRNPQWHVWAHNTIGTRYGGGFAGTFTDTTLSVTSGVLWDEDLRINPVATMTNCALWYRNVSNQNVFEAGITTPYKAAAGVLQYDNAGTLTNVSAANFVSSWVYATDDINYPIYVVVGQAQYNTIANARLDPQPAFPSFSVQEWRLLYQVIYKNVGGTPTYQEANDLRTVSTLPGATTPTVLPASSVTYAPNGNIASTNVQAAITELDTEKAALAGAAFTGDVSVNGTLAGTHLQFDGQELRETATDVDGAPVYINYRGYNGGTTRFRDFIVSNGKNATIMQCVGSTGVVNFTGTVNVNGAYSYLDGLRIGGADGSNTIYQSTPATDLGISTHSGFIAIKPGLSEVARFTASGLGISDGCSITIGNHSSAGSTTPLSIDMGGTFSTVAGANPKLQLYNGGGSAVYGFGVSGNHLDYMVPSGAGHYWYIDGGLNASLDGGGFHAGSQPLININRSVYGSAGINWYGANNAWQQYMGPPGASQGYAANLTAPTGYVVTDWALRSIVATEVAGFGWTWESMAAAGTTPAVVAELRQDGVFCVTNGIGIGCAPTTPLEVSSAGTTVVRITAAGGGASVIDATGGANALYLRTQGSDRAILTSTGLGIGISPYEKLHIYGASPRLLLHGSEGSAKNVSLRESAGSLYVGEYGVADWVTFTSTGLSVAGTFYAPTINGNYGSGIRSSGDIYVSRNASAGGALFLGDSGNVYLYYNNTNIQLTGAPVVTSHDLTVTGTLTATGDVVAQSDARLKTNIQPITNALDKVCALQGVTFNRVDPKTGEVNEARKMGFVAQQVEQVAPELVDKSEEYLAIAYGNTTALLVEALKEMRAELAMVKAELAALKEKK